MKNALIFIFILAVQGLSASQTTRIVSLAPALTEIVCHLGKGDLLVGRCSACDHPSAVKKLPSVGNFGIVKLEKILSLKPALVIGNDLMNPNIVNKLRQLKIKTIFRQIDSTADYLWWVKKLGDELNCQLQAQAELQRVQEFQKKFRRFKRLPLKVLWVVNAQPVIIAGRGSLPDQALELIKAENAAAVQQDYFKCSAEWLLTVPADLIIWNAPNKPDARHRLWGKVAAVKRDRIIELPVTDPVTRPGPRFWQSLGSLRKNIEKFVQEAR